MKAYQSPAGWEAFVIPHQSKNKGRIITISTTGLIKIVCPKHYTLGVRFVQHDIVRTHPHSENFQN